MNICVEQRIEKALCLSLGYEQVDAVEKQVEFTCTIQKLVHPGPSFFWSKEIKSVQNSLSSKIITHHIVSLLSDSQSQPRSTTLNLWFKSSLADFTNTLLEQRT